MPIEAIAQKNTELVGDVYDAKTQQLIYREHHEFSKEPNNEFMNTTYRDASGRVIGVRKVNKQEGRVTDYEFTQSDVDISKRLERTTEQITIEISENGEQKTKSFSPKNNEDVVINAGLFDLIERERESILNNEEIRFKLALPEKGRTVEMRINRKPYRDSNTKNFIDDDSLITLNMVIASRLLRLLVPPIELAYYPDTKQIAFYKGPSNLKDKDGKPIKEIYVLYNRDSRDALPE